MEDEQQPSNTKTSPPAATSSMRKLIFLLLGILVLVVAVAVIYESTKPDQKVATSDQSKTGLKTPAKIIINATGFTPAKTTIAKGGTVNWSNQDVTKHQIVISSYAGKENYSDFRTSDPIDIHGIYGITLYKVGTYSYNDVLDPNLKGTIQVK